MRGILWRPKDDPALRVLRQEAYLMSKAYRTDPERITPIARSPNS